MKQEFFILNINQIDGIFRSETEFKSSNEKYDWENYDWKDLEDDIKQQGILEVLGVCKIKDSEYEYMCYDGNHRIKVLIELYGEDYEVPCYNISCLKSRYRFVP